MHKYKKKEHSIQMSSQKACNYRGNVHKIQKPHKGTQSTVITKYIKPTQGRSSKQVEKLQNNKEKEEAYSLAGEL
jgi:hypothetical protein